MWTVGVAVAAAVLLVFVVLVTLGTLVLPGSGSQREVTVTEVQFTIVQGVNAKGQGWFGASSFVIKGASNGYPLSVAPGASFTLAVPLDNFDTVSHTLYSALPGAPFAFLRSSPVFDVTVPARGGEAVVYLTYVAPSSPGASLSMSVTINAEPPPP
jgi:hypothetical protein